VREEPAEPRPSSTVILLREERDGFSVLMLERHESIAFPGAHAFPGGIVEASDADACGALLPSAQQWAAAGEGDRPPEAIVYWMAAARELFEEVGILLARRHGRPVERLPGAQVADLRRRVLGGEPFGRCSRAQTWCLPPMTSSTSPAGSRRSRIRGAGTPAS